MGVQPDHLTNPAGRLRTWIQDLKRRSFPNSATCEHALSQTLGVPEGNKALLLFQMSRLLALPLQIRESFAQNPELPTALYLRWLPTVEQALSTMRLEEEVRHLIARFDPVSLYGLEIVDEHLQRRVPEKVLPPNVVEALTKEVSELLASVLQSELETDLKRFLVRQLSTIEGALREYRLSGTVPLENAVHAAVGSAFADAEKTNKSFATSEGKKAWDFVHRVSLALNITWAAMQIGNSGGTALANILIGQ